MKELFSKLQDDCNLHILWQRLLVSLFDHIVPPSLGYERKLNRDTNMDNFFRKIGTCVEHHPSRQFRVFVKSRTANLTVSEFEISMPSCRRMWEQSMIAFVELRGLLLDLRTWELRSSVCPRSLLISMPSVRRAARQQIPRERLSQRQVSSTPMRGYCHFLNSTSCEMFSQCSVGWLKGLGLNYSHPLHLPEEHSGHPLAGLKVQTACYFSWLFMEASCVPKLLFRATKLLSIEFMLAF